MILVIDVGNTNTVLGVYDGDELIANWRMTTEKSKTADELGIFLNSLFESFFFEVSCTIGALFFVFIPVVLLILKLFIVVPYIFTLLSIITAFLRFSALHILNGYFFLAPLHLR